MAVFDPGFWGQGVIAGAAGAVSMAIFACAVALARDTDGHDWYAAARITVADLLIGIGFDEDAPIEYRNADDVIETVSRYGLTVTLEARWAREDILEAARDGATLGALSGFGGALLCLGLVWRPRDDLRVRRSASYEPTPAQRPETRQRMASPREGPEAAPPGGRTRVRDRRAGRRADGRCARFRSPASRETGAACRKPSEDEHRQGQHGGPSRAAQARLRALDLMVASIGAVASPSQGASYYERDGYYAKDDPEHRAASAWAGRGAEALGLEGSVDPDTFKAVLEGEVPDGSGKRLGRRTRDGDIHHRPGRDPTFSAPKSVSLAALIGGDARIVEAHDRAVGRALGWFERNAAETRVQDPESGRMVRTGDQKAVVATFRHETSRNLDPALHTHSVIANMVLGKDGKWRTMANESLYASKMLLGALYRSELAGELGKLGYGIEKTHADGHFEIAGVSRHVIDAFSTRRAEIEAAMEGRGLGSTAENQHLARRAALMTRASKRDVDREALRETWARQAAGLGFDAKALVAEAMERSPVGAETARDGAKDIGKGDGSAAVRQTDLFEFAARAEPAREAVDWALAHLSERDAVFARTDLLAATLAYSLGAASIDEIERAVNGLMREGRLHDAPAFPGSGPGQAGGGLTTDKAIAQERETVALMRSGEGRGKAPMRGWTVDRHLRRGPLTSGQKQAVKLILSEKDRTVGVQSYAGTGKTRMLNRARTLAEKKGWRMVGLAPSASAVRTLAAESGIESETLQRFLARNAGVAEGRLAKKGAKEMRSAFAKTILVVDEGSLASTVQARNLLRIARELRIPKLVLVGDAKQLDAVDWSCPLSVDSLRPAMRCGQAAAFRTGMPSCLALSTRLSVMPEPGKAMTPLGRRFSSSSLRRKGAARPCWFQSGLQTIWWTPLRSAQLAAMRSTPVPPPCTRMRSAYFARALSRRSMTAAGFAMSLPPAMATKVPFGRCASVLRSLRARMKSRASMAALVSLPVCETWLPWRGRQTSPVALR